MFTGEPAAIVEEVVWQRVQTILQRHGKDGGNGGGLVRNKHGALQRKEHQ